MLATLLDGLTVLAGWGGRVAAPVPTAAEIRSRSWRRRDGAADEYGYWWTVGRGA